MKTMIFASALMLLSVTVAVPTVEAQPDSRLRKKAILATISESALSAASLLQDRTGSGIRQLSWSASYSEHGWALREKGRIGKQTFGMKTSGYLWGEYGKNWAITYSGYGVLAGQPMYLYGHAGWIYDNKTKKYKYVNFHQAIEFGDHSTWGLVLAAELLVGAIGGSGAAIAAAVGTGGIMAPASIFIGLGAAIPAEAAMLSISNGARTLLAPDKPPSPTAIPRPPKPPLPGKPILSNGNAIIIVISPQGEIGGRGPDVNIRIVGKYIDKKGSAEGSIASVSTKH